MESKASSKGIDIITLLHLLQIKKVLPIQNFFPDRNVAARPRRLVQVLT
jgi:hypothetical protein